MESSDLSVLEVERRSDLGDLEVGRKSGPSVLPRREVKGHGNDVRWSDDHRLEHEPEQEA